MKPWERPTNIPKVWHTLCLFSRNVSSTFSFHTLLFIGPLQKEVRCASSKTFQYHIFQKKGTLENSSLRFPLNHCYLSPTQYNQKFNYLLKWDTQKYSNSRRTYTRFFKHHQHPYTCYITQPVQGIILEHFSWLLELKSGEAERERRAAVVPATSAGLEPRLPSYGRPLHAFHCNKFMLRPVFKNVWLQRNMDLTKQLCYPAIQCWKSKLQSMNYLQSTYCLAACSYHYL